MRGGTAVTDLPPPSQFAWNWRVWGANSGASLGKFAVKVAENQDAGTVFKTGSMTFRRDRMTEFDPSFAERAAIKPPSAESGRAPGFKTSERVGATIAGMMKGAGAEVVELPGRRGAK